MEDANLLTMVQVAERLNVSLSTVKRLCRQGNRTAGRQRLRPLPSIRVGGSRRFLETDLTAWIEERRTR